MPGVGSGKLLGGPGGRAGIPKTPKPPCFPPNATRLAQGTCRRWSGKTEELAESLHGCRCPWHPPHTHGPGTGADRTRSTVQQGRGERSAGRDCLCTATRSAALPHANAGRARRRSSWSLHTSCVCLQEPWTRCVVTGAAAVEKQQGQELSQPFPGDVTGMSGAAPLTAAQPERLTPQRGEGCFPLLDFTKFLPAQFFSLSRSL